MLPLEQRFSQLINNLNPRILPNEVAMLWVELVEHYEAKGRYYHNLSHLENMLAELAQFPDSINDPLALKFSIFYHDYIYQATRKDNEHQSAVVAQAIIKKSNLTATDGPDKNTFSTKVYQQILATKDHLLPANSSDPDLSVLLDIDLAILGGSPAIYQAYTKAIRKEYRIYPDFLYYPARRKAMRKFLERDHIYHTAFFRQRYEERARENILTFDL